MPTHTHEYEKTTKEVIKRPSLLNQGMAGIEAFLWICYFMNTFKVQAVTSLLIMVLSLRYLREKYSVLSNWQYYQNGEMFRDESIKLMIYAFILKTVKLNLIVLLPFTVIALFYIFEYFYRYLRYYH